MPDGNPQTGGARGSAAAGTPDPAATRSLGRTLSGLVATVTGNLFLLVGTLVFAACTVATGWIPLPRGGRAFFFWARLWGRLVLLSSGVRVRAELQAPLSRDRVYVFLSNHQSLFDIPVLLATLPVPARFLAKRELFAIPLFGWALRVGGFIPVERRSKNAGDSFRAAADRLRHGGSVLLFPEETRSTDGQLLPFKRGGFLLAQRAGLPMVPVGIRGTRQARAPKSFRIQPGRVLVCYGAPLDPVGGGRGGTVAAAATVRARIAELAGVELEPATDAVSAPAGAASGAAGPETSGGR